MSSPVRQSPQCSVLAHSGSLEPTQLHLRPHFLGGGLSVHTHSKEEQMCVGESRGRGRCPGGSCVAWKGKAVLKVSSHELHCTWQCQSVLGKGTGQGYCRSQNWGPCTKGCQYHLLQSYRTSGAPPQGGLIVASSSVSLYLILHLLSLTGLSCVRTHPCLAVRRRSPLQVPLTLVPSLQSAPSQNGPGHFLALKKRPEPLTWHSRLLVAQPLIRHYHPRVLLTALPSPSYSSFWTWWKQPL